MLWYGARLVMAGALTPGALVVFLLYLGKMYKPMRDLSKMTDTVSRAAVSLERIREVLDTESGVRNVAHARKAARARTASSLSASAKKAARTKGPARRKAAARKAARTRARRR